MKPMRVVLASSNLGKMAEIEDYLKDVAITLLPQSGLGIEDAEETGLTFIENAILKARHAAKLSGLPAIADDSGLVVNALADAPGVYSARYAGVNATNQERINKVLAELKKINAVDRSAAFHCAFVFLRHETDPAPIVCHASWRGTILEEPRGAEGFGYDPIFYVASEGCTAAELPLARKNKISHRGQALAQFITIINR